MRRFSVRRSDMSAIVGIYHLNGVHATDEQGYNIMKHFQKFPSDATKVWKQNEILFGCMAQWITPESIGEQLPYYDPIRQYAITADAIIDNRKELANLLGLDKLESKSITDSSLILLAYDKWLEDTPKYLIGDFAFMIWDGRRQRLFGARDFSGSRTLYYYRKNGHFSFATLLEPLLNSGHVSSQLNEEWLAEYLAVSAVTDTADASITPYQDIAQLPPSHSIIVTSNSIRVTRYMTLKAGSTLKLGSNEEYIEAFQAVFQEAVNSRLRTHGQIGAQLSGGLDSGAVVSFASKSLKKANESLHTFSYVPPKDFQDFTPKHLLADETPYIKSTVQYVGGINDYYLDFQGSNSYTDIDEVLDIMEMPYKFFENSFWIKGIFQKAEEEKLKVLLSGERGNLSISWGTALDYYSSLFKKARWIKLYKELTFHSKRVGGSRLKKFNIISKSALFNRGTASDNYPVLINPNFANKTAVYEKLAAKGMDRSGWYDSRVTDERAKHFEDVFQWNTTNSLATKLSLKHGLWKRDPTNDLRVIKFCLSLPEEQFVQDGLDRALIRRSTKSFLPDNVRLNQRVRGVQGADWVHRMVPDWQLFVDEVQMMSQNEQMMEYLNREAIHSGLEKIKEGPMVEHDTDLDYRILMRSLIVYRFLTKSY